MATPLDDEGVFKTPAPPPLRKASNSLSSFSMIQKAGPSLLQPVGSPLSLGISGPNTPQSELSDCSYLQLQGVPENSRYFCTASAIDVNVAYQEHLKETLNRIEMNLIENRYRQQEIIEKLLKLELDQEEEPQRKILTPYLIKAPFFKSKSYPGGPPPNPEALRIQQEDMQRPHVTVLKRLDWTASDRRILFNGVKQQCLSMVMKPFIDKQSTISHKLDSLNPYELDSRRVLAEELNLSELEVRRLKENPPKDEELFGSRKRCDIDWVYISLHLFNNQRDPDDCKLQWQNFLHPGVNKEHWSPDESRKMLQTVAKHQEKQPFVIVEPTETVRSSSTRRHIDWKQVSILHGNRRTPFDCFQSYMSRLVSARGWTPTEIKLLKRVVNTFQFGNKISWSKIADFFDGRSPHECSERWRRMSSYALRLGRWSPDEDILLLKAVEKFGIGMWIQISREVPLRTDQQCRERYMFQLSGNYVKESWTKAADETLIDLMLKHGPTADCAIIAEKTLKKQRKEIYRRFRYLLENQRKGTEASHRKTVRRTQLTETADRLREQNMTDQIIAIHQNLVNNSSENKQNTPKPSKLIKKPASLIHNKVTKHLKLGDKLKMLEPEMIDAQFLKSEFKKNLPKYKHPPIFYSTSRLEKLDHYLDEIIFRNCLPKHSTSFTLSPNLENPEESETKEPKEKELAGLMTQLITLLKIDYLGAWKILKLKSSPEFRESITSLSIAKDPNEKERILNPKLFLNNARKLMEEGHLIVKECFKDKLNYLYELRLNPIVQSVVKEVAEKTHSPPKGPIVRTQIVQYPTCVVLPTPGAYEDDASSEIFGSEQLDEYEEKTVDELIECLEDEEPGTMNFDLFTSDNENSPSKKARNFESPLKSKTGNDMLIEQNGQQGDNISHFLTAKSGKLEGFDQDMKVKELIKKFPIRRADDPSDDISRDFFIENYGFKIIPGETSQYIRVLLEGNSFFSTIIQRDLMWQLVNVDTNKGKRTLAIPIASVPFEVNDGGKEIHFLPEAGASQTFELPVFEKLEKSPLPMSDLIEKYRAQKALEQANTLLESAIGRTFMTTDEKIKFQDWVRDMPQDNNLENLTVPLVAPNKAVLDLWKRLDSQSANLLCKGLVCYKHARSNRTMMKVARKMFEQNTDPFKYKMAEIAFQLGVYFTVDKSKTMSTVHKLLYQPIRNVPEFASLETIWQKALLEDNDELIKLHEKLFEQSDKMQSILDEIKATAVYQLFRSRLYALLLFPKAMSEAGPREIGKETSGEVNNNASKKNEQISLSLYKHFTRKRCNKPQDSWFHDKEPDDSDFEALRRLQRELQSDLAVTERQQDSSDLNRIDGEEAETTDTYSSIGQNVPETNLTEIDAVETGYMTDHIATDSLTAEPSVITSDSITEPDTTEIEIESESEGVELPRVVMLNDMDGSNNIFDNSAVKTEVNCVLKQYRNVTEITEANNESKIISSDAVASNGSKSRKRPARPCLGSMESKSKKICPDLAAESQIDDALTSNTVLDL